MDIKNKINLSIVISYIVIQLVSYIFGIFVDLPFPVKYVYYIFICLNFLFSIYLLVVIKTKDSLIMSLGLMFTLISDTFLVLLGGYKVIAMISFVIVQVIYWIRLINMRNNKSINICDFVRIALVLIMVFLAAIIVGESFDSLVFVTCIYYPLLLINFIESIIYFKNNMYFSVGLACFILCDTIVGLTNCSSYLGIKESVIKLLIGTIDTAWLFYYPSQILLVLSIIKNNIKTGERHG